MNNRGFTLIELLAVVVVLGIVGTIVTINLASTFNDTQDKECDKYKIDAAEAACLYADIDLKNNLDNLCKQEYIGEERQPCYITFETLINEGLIKEENNSCEDVTASSTIKVSWDDDGFKECVYQGD